MLIYIYVHIAKLLLYLQLALDLQVIGSRKAGKANHPTVDDLYPPCPDTEVMSLDVGVMAAVASEMGTASASEKGRGVRALIPYSLG